MLGLQNPKAARLGRGRAWHLATSAQNPESRNFFRGAQMDWAEVCSSALLAPYLAVSRGGADLTSAAAVDLR
jgi:hypothetical protein